MRAPRHRLRLTTYEEAKDHAEMVAEVVREERMPPWYANAKYNHFVNAPGMTAESEPESWRGLMQVALPAIPRADRHHCVFGDRELAHR